MSLNLKTELMKRYLFNKLRNGRGVRAKRSHAFLLCKQGDIKMQKILSNKQFSQNLKNIRIKSGLTQEQTVAKLQLLGSPISRSTYSLIEMGRGNIFISDLVGLQQMFNAEYKGFF